MVLGNLGIRHLGPDRRKPSQSPAFVGTDQPRIARHIGGEDRGKATGLAHVVSSIARRRPKTNKSTCSGSRNGFAVGTIIGVSARSRLTVVRASSSRPICA